MHRRRQFEWFAFGALRFEQLSEDAAGVVDSRVRPDREHGENPYALHAELQKLGLATPNVNQDLQEGDIRQYNLFQADLMWKF